MMPFNAGDAGAEGAGRVHRQPLIGAGTIPDG
jgi:hypothetical protein